MIVLPKLTAGDFQGKGECPTFFTAQIFAETSMRTRMLAAVSLILVACAGSEAPPTLSITPSGAQTISGPVTVTASPASLTNDVTWSLSGPGTISGTKGISVVYRPPVPADPSPATVTASALGSQTASVTFTSQTLQQPS